MHFFRFDSETNLIVPGLLAPEPICLQSAFDDNPVRLMSHVEEGWLDDFSNSVLDPQCYVEAHNSPFDYAVIAAAFPDLLAPIFRMLGALRGRDTLILAKLAAIADGTLQRFKNQKFDLDSLVQKLGGKVLSKGQDSWRTRYATLKGIPSKEYPEEARLYCIEDVEALRNVSVTLRQRFSSPDEGLQVAAAFALHLAACWGVRTDPEALTALENRLLAENVECERILTDAGFFRDGSVNTKAVKAAVESACERLGKTVPKTEKGATKMDEDTMDLVESAADPALKSLIKFKKNQKNLGTYIEPMKGGMHQPMNSRPNVLVATGRTSWGGMELELRDPWDETGAKPQKVKVGTNLQNQSRLAGLRDCFVPRTGHLWLSVDYDSLEVRTFAQACLWVTGRSSLADRYREDPEYDPHSELAGKVCGISYHEALERKKNDKTFKKTWRQWAKAGVFGFPGGMSARKFVLYTNGMIEDPANHITEEMAHQIRNSWFDLVPEARLYFDHISWLADSGQSIRQFVSRRMRGDIGFCDGANTLFQGLAADGAKRALFATSMACFCEPDSPLFGSRPVAFIHDEICAEVPEAKGHEAAMETVRLMEREMALVIPDVPIKASPALSRRWVKAAEAKFSEEGILIPWD